MLNARSDDVGPISPDKDRASSAARTSEKAEGEQRTGERVWTMMRIAKLTTVHGDDLGIVRNVSSHGMMIEVHAQMPIDGEVTVDFGVGVALRGTVRWRNGGSIGLHFAKALNVKKLLEKPGVDGEGQLIRQPRIAMRHPVKLVCGDKVMAGEICNISLGGARIAMESALVRGAQVDVVIPVIGKVAGVVRWTANGFSGLSFNRPVSIHALMAWRAACVQSPATADGPDDAAADSSAALPDSPNDLPDATSRSGIVQG
jgi:hypothetical protein